MLFSNVFSDMFDDMFDMPTANQNAKGLMNCDVKEYDDHYELDLDMAGFKKGDIKAELKDGYLTIKAERRNEHEEKDKSYVRCERSYGSYQRAFDISGVEVANISAQYNDGVLKLNMPKKSAVVNAKQIEIQ